MSELSYQDAPVPIRADIEAEHRRAWAHIAAPGRWFTGEERVAIAAETRHAPDCELSIVRKAALSPYAVEGEYDTVTDLPDPVIDVIHRVATDPGRLTRAWYDSVIAAGLTSDEYVEVVGVMVTTITVDTFAHAIGMERPPLPEPQPGEPSRERPPEASQGEAWVPWIAKGDATGIDAELFGPDGANVRRALSLVPPEAHNFMGIVNAQYMPVDEMLDFDTEFRTITRPQMELIAGRISAINQCAY